MATPGIELDPVFLRALRLLQSRSEDSAHQLRLMLDDCLRQSTSPHSFSEKGSVGLGMGKKFESEASKRNLDRLARDLSEVVPTIKKSRHDSPGSTKSHTPSPAPTSPGFFERGSTGSQSIQSSSSSSAEEMDVDLNMEALGDCTCCICKSFNQENGNKLMECHTCQNLYHQECHIPMVSNEEAADPRLVWNCTSCSKTIKKVAPIKPPISSNLSKSTKSSNLNMKSSRDSPSKMDGSASIFKRNEKSSGSSSTGGGKPGILSGSGRTGLGSSSSSSSSSGSSGSSTLISADKRLAMMKKKAAAQRKAR